MRNTPRIVVLAKNLRMFHAWCRETGHSPRDRDVTYAVGPHVLHAVDSAQIVRFGDWRDRPDVRALEEAVARLERRTGAPVHA